MTPQLQKFHLENDGKNYATMQAWLVICNEYGKLDYSPLFCSLEEAHKWVQERAREKAKSMEFKLTNGNTLHIPFNVVYSCKVEGKLKKVVDPEDIGLEYTCVMRSLTFDADVLKEWADEMPELQVKV